MDPEHGPRAVLLERTGCTIQVSAGRVDTLFIGPTEVLESVAQARARLHGMVNRFERKGYAASLRNAELERPLATWPDDPTPYLVYADWLSEHGDPRGELIRLQLALEATPDDPALLQRQAALLDLHRVRLVPIGARELVWRRGLILGVRLQGWTLPPSGPPSWVRRRALGDLAAVRRHASGCHAAWLDLVTPGAAEPWRFTLDPAVAEPG